MPTAQMRDTLRTKATIPGVRSLVDSVLYDTIELAAATLPPTTTFFTAIKAPHLSNLEKANEVVYPFYIQGMALYVEGSLADAKLALWYSTLRLQISNKDFPRFPAVSLPSGGGLAGDTAIADGTAATDSVSEMINNGAASPLSIYKLRAPLKLIQDLQFRVIMESDPAQTLVAATNVIMCLFGMELRRLL